MQHGGDGPRDDMQSSVDDAMYDAKCCLEYAEDALEQAEDDVHYALDERLDSVYDRGHGGGMTGGFV